MMIESERHLREPAAAAAALALVLVVDDAPADAVLTALRAAQCRVLLAGSSGEGLALARREPPDLILLRTGQRPFDGLEVCRQFKADSLTAQVPVLLLTEPVEPEDQGRGFEAGCADYIALPCHPATLLARVTAQLQRQARQHTGACPDGTQQAELLEQLQQVDAMREATLFEMISFAEFRADDTGNHLRRTQEYMRVLASWLQCLGDARYALSAGQIDLIAKSAPLHDIGKVTIPDGILLKPGRLTPDEFSIMKTHALRGWELLHRAAERLGEHDSRCLQPAMDIARHHHERWDGSGYPDGLAGEAIPLSARMMAVADVYDALISQRPYKGPMDPDEALRLIGSEAGRQFDPTVVMAMQATFGQIAEIAARWPD